MSFFVFDFWHFKLVPIDSALYSGAIKSNFFSPNIRAWQLKQQSSSKNCVKTFLKCHLPHIAAKQKSAGFFLFFYIKLTKNRVGKIFAYFRFCPSLGGSGVPNWNQKCRTWVSHVLVKILIFQMFFKHFFCLLKYYLWCKSQNI